jgi:hypothetical protein
MPLAVYSKHIEPLFSLFFHEFKILLSHALKAVNNSQFRLSPLSLFVSCSFKFFFISKLIFLLWSCGPMDKAPAYGARDSRFEPPQDRHSAKEINDDGESVKFS